MTIIPVSITSNCLIRIFALLRGHRQLASEKGVGDSVNISLIHIASAEGGGVWRWGWGVCTVVYDVCMDTVITDGSEAAAIPIFASPSVRSDRLRETSALN